MKGLIARGRRPLSGTAFGAVIAAGILVVLVLVYQKDAIVVALRGGDEIEVEFAGPTKLIPNNSDVKIAGSIVGTVSGLEHESGGTTSISMKVDGDVADKLGGTPSAVVRATTLLGGNYYVDLIPADDGREYDGTSIPSNRTRLPVELDQVLSAVPDSAQRGLQSMTRQLDGTLHNGGQEAIQELVRNTPDTLRPGASVLSAMRGEHPETDLRGLVVNVQGFAEAMTEREGQLGDIVNSLERTSATLSDRKEPLASAVGDLPATLTATRTGMRSLGGSLDRLGTTASNIRPTIHELDPLLEKTDAVLKEARPVVADLRPALEDLRPGVEQLVPAAGKATDVLNNVNGPVLDRVKGPITETVTSPWKGTGYYTGNGNDNLFYQEVGYLAARGANLSQYGDKNGSLLALALGVGGSSVGGADLTIYEYLQMLGTLPEKASAPRVPTIGLPGAPVPGR